MPSVSDHTLTGGDTLPSYWKAKDMPLASDYKISVTTEDISVNTNLGEAEDLLRQEEAE